MTDSTPVRRYIGLVHTLTSSDGLIPLADAEPVGVVLASDYDRLQAERDSLRAQLAARDERIQRLCSQLAAALAKVEEAEKDAERYRWLRGNYPLKDGTPFIAIHNAGGFSQWTDAAADKAIDAERSKT